MFHVTLPIHDFLLCSLSRLGHGDEISGFLLWTLIESCEYLIAFGTEDCCYLSYLTMMAWVQRSYHIGQCLANSMNSIYICWLEECHKLMFNMSISFFEVYGYEKLLQKSIYTQFFKVMTVYFYTWDCFKLLIGVKISKIFFVFLRFQKC